MYVFDMKLIPNETAQLADGIVYCISNIVKIAGLRFEGVGIKKIHTAGTYRPEFKEEYT